MTDTYNPTTDQIRAAWVQKRWDHLKMLRGESIEEFNGWLARYRESVIDEVEDHLVRRDQFTERTLDVIDELREKK